MADEARISAGLNVRKVVNGVTLLEYQSRPAAFTADVAGTKGPVPGAIAISRFGTDINLGELVNPGLCRIMNLDDENAMRVGIYNTDQAEFYPFLKLLPGESFVIRLDPDVNEEYAGTGTGTTGEANTLRAIAENETSNLLVEAFEA
jgi:hypothetical protein